MGGDNSNNQQNASNGYEQPNVDFTSGQQAGQLFQSNTVAQLANGDIIQPESEAEEDFLHSVANNDTLSDEQKERVARMGTLFAPTAFDVNFADNRRQQYPTDLDPQIRQMIRET